MKKLLACGLAVLALSCLSNPGNAGTTLAPKKSSSAADPFTQLQNSPDGYWVSAPTPRPAYPPPGYYAGPPPPYYYGPGPYGPYYGPRYYYGPPPPGPVIYGPRIFFGFRIH